MKTVSRTVAALLALGLCSAVAAETDYNTFKEKTAEFSTPGQGEPASQYAMIVPEGVTVTTPQGQVFQGGEIITIPGERISVLAVLAPAAAEQAASQYNTFNDRTKVTPTPDAQDIVALVALQVPAGAVITAADGREVKGEAEITFLVKAAEVRKTEQPAVADMTDWNTFNKR